MAEPLVTFTIPGDAAGKKNAQIIAWPQLRDLGLYHDRRPVMGVKALLAYALSLLRRGGTDEAIRILARAAQVANPVIQPSAEHARWHRRALEIALNVSCLRPCAPEGHMVRVQTVVYMGRGATGDLDNILFAVHDLLQDAGIIQTDHWINSHDGSERRWDQPDAPRIEVSVFDIGPKVGFRPPGVRVEGLTAAADKLGPLIYDVVAPDERRLEGLQGKRKWTRDRLVLEATRLWRMQHGESLPEGTVIYVGGAPAASRRLF